MSTVKQPVLGVVATAVVVALSLGFISLFAFPTFTGWVAYFLLCVIPMHSDREIFTNLAQIWP